MGRRHRSGGTYVCNVCRVFTVRTLIHVIVWGTSTWVPIFYDSAMSGRCVWPQCGIDHMSPPTQMVRVVRGVEVGSLDVSASVHGRRLFSNSLEVCARRGEERVLCTRRLNVERSDAQAHSHRKGHIMEGSEERGPAPRAVGTCGSLRGCGRASIGAARHNDPTSLRFSAHQFAICAS